MPFSLPYLCFFLLVAVQAAVVGESLGTEALQAQHRLLAAGAADAAGGGGGGGYSEALPLGGKGYQASGGRGRGGGGSGKGTGRRRGSMGASMGAMSGSSGGGGGNDQNDAAEVMRSSLVYACSTLMIQTEYLAVLVCLSECEFINLGVRICVPHECSCKLVTYA